MICKKIVKDQCKLGKIGFCVECHHEYRQEISNFCECGETTVMIETNTPMKLCAANVGNVIDVKCVCGAEYFIFVNDENGKISYGVIEKNVITEKYIKRREVVTMMEVRL